jgi:hypothetical protein
MSADENVNFVMSQIYFRLELLQPADGVLPHKHIDVLKVMGGWQRWVPSPSRSTCVLNEEFT